MLDDDDDSHLSRETNPIHVIALINLDNLYFVRHRRRMILNSKKESTKRKRSQYQSQTSPLVSTIVEFTVASLPITQRTDRFIHRIWEVERYECISKEDRWDELKRMYDDG